MGRQPFRQMKTDGTMEEAGGASGGSSATDERPTKSIGRLTTATRYNYFCTQSSTSWSNYTLNYANVTANNKVLLIPMVAPRTGTIDGMRINVRTASSIIGDTLKMALYRSGDNNMPNGSQIVGSESIDITTTGMKSLTGGAYSVNAGDVLWGAFGADNPSDSNGAKYFIGTAHYGSHGTGVKLPQNSTYNANDPTKYIHTVSGEYPTSFSETDFNTNTADLNYRQLQWWITYSG